MRIKLKKYFNIGTKWRTFKLLRFGWTPAGVGCVLFAYVAKAMLLPTVKRAYQELSAVQTANVINVVTDLRTCSVCRWEGSWIRWPVHKYRGPTTSRRCQICPVAPFCPQMRQICRERGWFMEYLTFIENIERHISLPCFMIGGQITEVTERGKGSDQSCNR